MVKQSIERLSFLCETIPPLLNCINEKNFTEKPGQHKWCKKEIIGHLIDSATNNHQRFVRGQFEDNPVILYDTDKWNTFNHYMKISSGQIILFWETYNRQLLALIKNIPADKLKNKINTGEAGSYTLEFLIRDYLVHLEHHLQQVLVY